MVIVDTSIWIRQIAGVQPFKLNLETLIRAGQVVGHELVYGELLIGDRGGRRNFLAAYQLLDRARTLPHDDVDAFVRNRKLHGRGIGWIDAHLLASALVGRFRLWTADADFYGIAEEMGINWKT